MKRFLLLSSFIIVTTCAMAQRNKRADSLLNALKNFSVPNQSFQLQNTFKLSPKDSLLDKMYTFKVPGNDTLQSLKSKSLIKQNGVYHSSVDHMPIAALPSNSRMPVYKLQRSTDKMPGSNLPQPIVPVTPQK